MAKKYVFAFGAGKSEGDASMKGILGGKGANLCEMVNLGLPIPPGFVISTECCQFFSNQGKYPSEVRAAVAEAVASTEKAVGRKFGDTRDPLLLSIRSGAAVSLPGMMDTVLNLGLTDASVAALVKRGGNVHFVWDSYRRFIAMYSNVVKQLDMHPFEHELDEAKKNAGQEGTSASRSKIRR